jgi:hypothetical protein
MGAHRALQVGVMRFSVRIRCAVEALRLMAMVMGPATAILVTARDMGPATATQATATLITPLSDVLSMPPLLASGVIGATELSPL